MFSNEILFDDTLDNITINESGNCFRRLTRSNKSQLKLVSNTSERSTRNKKLSVLKENVENELNESEYNIFDSATGNEEIKDILINGKCVEKIPIDIKACKPDKLVISDECFLDNKLNFNSETKLLNESNDLNLKRGNKEAIKRIDNTEKTFKHELSSSDKYFDSTDLNYESYSKLSTVIDENHSKKELLSDNSNIFEDSLSLPDMYNTFNENLTENVLNQHTDVKNKNLHDLKSISKDNIDRNISKDFCKSDNVSENSLKIYKLRNLDKCTIKEIKNEKNENVSIKNIETDADFSTNKLKDQNTGSNCLADSFSKFVSKKSIENDTNKLLNDDKKDRSNSLTTQECCQLAAWSLPDGILQKYKERGVETMFSWQVECLRNTGVLQKDMNLVYSAPTSAGKTLVAEILTIKTVIERRKKVIFILPFVSVVREKMFYFREIFSSTGIRTEGFMGSYNPPGGFSSVHVAICTIEKANSLINRMLEDSTVEDLGAVIVDELHLLGDPNRGYLLELLLTKLLYISLKNQTTSLRIIGMSATLPNLPLLSKWLNASLYKTDFRPIPLFEKCHIEGHIYNSNLKLERVIHPHSDLPDDNDNVVQLCLEVIAKSCSVLIFCTAKNWCENLAQQISSTFRRLGCSDSIFKSCLQSEIKTEMIVEVLEQLKRCPVGLDRMLKSTVSFGVAYHHAGLTMDERDIIESAFRNGALKVLIATSTLSSGVNLPARRVIIRTAMFAGRPIDTLSYKQMVGRAGRTGRDIAGESILICKKHDSAVAKSLMTASLKPISSCLIESGKLKRAILEVIASGVVSTLNDIKLFTKCTLLAVEDNLELENPIESSINFLQRNEFIRLQNTDNGDNCYIPTPLAKACLSSSISPEEGLTLFEELEKARQCFVLESELHIVYLVTPYSACYSWGNLDWMSYLSIYEKLPVCDQRVANLVGISEAFIVSAMNGKSISSNLHHKLQIHKRFYTALALLELVNEVPLHVVAEKYKCSRGLLQALQQSASTFAGMVTSFCKQLGWSSVEILVHQFQDRLQFGINRELLDLMRLPSLNGLRARALYNFGIESVVCLANSDVTIVENALYRSIPFQSEKEREGESSYEAKERNRLKTIWITGKEGLTEKQAAEMLIDEARQYLQLELGLAEAKWDKQLLNTKTDSSSVEEKNSLFSNKSTYCENSSVSKKSLTGSAFNDSHLNVNEKSVDTISVNLISNESKGNLSGNNSFKSNIHSNESKNQESEGGTDSILELKPCDEQIFDSEEVSSRKAYNNDRLLKSLIANKNIVDFNKNIDTTLKELTSNISKTKIFNRVPFKEKASKCKKLKKVSRKKMGKNVRKLYKDFVPASEILFNESFFNTSAEKILTLKSPEIKSTNLNSNELLEIDHKENIPIITNNNVNISFDGYNLRSRHSNISNKSNNSNKNIFSDSFLLDSNISALFNTSFLKLSPNLSVNKNEDVINTSNKDTSKNNRKRKSPLSDSGLEFGETSFFEQAFITSFSTDDNECDNNMIFSTPIVNNIACKDSVSKILNLSINDDVVANSPEQHSCLKTTINNIKPDNASTIEDSSPRKKVRSIIAKREKNKQKYQKNYTKEEHTLKSKEDTQFKLENQSIISTFQSENCTNIENLPNNLESFDLEKNVDNFNKKIVPCISELISKNEYGEHTRKIKPKRLCNTKPSLVSIKKRLGNPKQGKYIDHFDLNGMKMVNVCEDKRYFKFCNLQLMKQRVVSLCVGCENHTKAKKTIGMRIVKNRSTAKRCTDVKKLVYDRYQIKNIAVYWGGKSVYYFQMFDDEKKLNVDFNEVIGLLRRFFARKDVIVQQFDCKEQLKILSRCCQIDLDCRFEDPKIADWMIQPEDEEKSLQAMAIKYCPKFASFINLNDNKNEMSSIGLSLDSTIVSHIRASAEAILTWKILQKQKNVLIKQNPNFIQTFDIEMKSLVCLTRLELSGFCINLDALENLAIKIREYILEIEKSAFSLAGRSFSFSSSRDVAKVVGLYKGRKVSTSKQVLEQVDNPLSDLIILWRKLHFASNKIILPITRAADGKSRIHCYSIFHNATGRISMQEPSLQMVPRDFDIELNGHLKRISIRQVFMPSENCILLSADYCQLELRLLAHFSQDELLCDVMRSGMDIFRSIAANWNNISVFKVTETQRQQVKQLCYGIIYGMGSKTLSDFLQIDEYQAAEFRESFKNFYPGVKAYLTQVIVKCKKNGYVETLHGRRRYLPHIHDKSPALKSQAERQAINTTIQGSAADIVKAAMVNVDSKLRERYPWRVPSEITDTQDNGMPRVNFVLYLHDELIFEVTSSILHDIASIVKHALEESVNLSIPFPVKIRAGVSWGDLEELQLD